MKVSEMFPGKYFKASDLKGGSEYVYSVARITIVDFEGTEKPVMYFNDARQALILNRSNMLRLASGFGDETEQWVGQRVALHVTEVPFRGDLVPAIYARPALEQPSPQTARPEHRVADEPSGSRKQNVRKASAAAPVAAPAPVELDPDGGADDSPFAA